MADPRNNYAVALEKPAVKPVTRLHNIITSCQSSKVFTGFKFIGDITISSKLKSIRTEMFHDQISPTTCWYTCIYLSHAFVFLSGCSGSNRRNITTANTVFYPSLCYQVSFSSPANCESYPFIPS